MPSVSIIVPTFNRLSQVLEVIESVRRQTHADWELVVIDDGSTDGTYGAVAAIADSRIKYIVQENLGVSAARNRGVSEAGSQFIAFLDSDDLWLPQKLRVQLELFATQPDISICQTEEIWVRNGRRVNPCTRHRKHSGWIFRECLPMCIVSPSAVMMRREIFNSLGGFDESLPCCEDYDLWLRAALRYRIVTIPEPLIVKRGGHPGQLSCRWGLDRYRIVALKKILGDGALPDDFRPLVVSEIVRRSKIIAEGARKRGNLKLCSEYETKTMDYGP